MREFACARCGTKLVADASPPSALCPRCQFVNVILPVEETGPAPPELTREIRLSAEEHQFAFPEFAREESCRTSLAHLGAKNYQDIVRLLMGGRTGMTEKQLMRVRSFRSKGKREYYWRRAAEYTTKARVRDFLDKVWHLL